MHNRLKVHTTEAQKAAINREKEKKLQLYRKSIDDVFGRRFRNEYDDLALKSCEGLLRANPDIVTLWNYRKEILLRLKPSKEIINEELYLTEKCLQVNPKSYSAWYHRNWVLDNVDLSPDWNNELSLCTKYLKMDERNFHCWDYRQIVVSKCKEPHENELNFTMEMIESNFSNYSAWHYRSKLFSAAGKDECTKISELSLVENAAFTDPSDQSAWIYQRWLIGKLEPSKYIYKVSQINNTIYILLNRNLPHNYKIIGLGNTNWKQLDSKIWFKIKVDNIDDTYVEIIDEVNQVINKTLIDNVEQDIFNLNISEKLRFVLNAQLDSLRQLLEMEPESKWALLTYVLLLYTLKPKNYFENCLKNIKLLKVIDTSRKNYYQDLESRYQIEYWISNNKNISDVNLKGHRLTAFYHMHMFLFNENIDLSNNDFSNSTLSHLKYLMRCKNLSLKNCQLVNLDNLPALPSLEVLDIRENKIQEISCKNIEKYKSLKTILLDNKQTVIGKILQEINPSINIKIE